MTLDELFAAIGRLQVTSEMIDAELAPLKERAKAEIGAQVKATKAAKAAPVKKA